MSRETSNLDVLDAPQNRNVHQTSMKRPRVKPSQRRQAPFFMHLDVWTFGIVATNTHPFEKKTAVLREKECVCRYRMRI